MFGKLLCKIGWHKWEKVLETTLSKCVRCNKHYHFHEWKYEQGGYVGGPFNHVVGARSCPCGLKQLAFEYGNGYDGGSSYTWKQVSEDRWNRSIRG